MTHMMGFNDCFGDFDHYPLIDKLSGCDYFDRNFQPVEDYLQGETCKLITLTDARELDAEMYALALDMVNAAFLAGYKVGRNPDLILLSSDFVKEAQGKGNHGKA